MSGPQYWLQNHATDWEWDAALNALLDHHKPIKSGIGYTVHLGGVEVWARNYPYAYGTPYSPSFDVLPSVATRKRLRAAIKATEREHFRTALAAAGAA
jgi:hypothetical protein